MEILIRPSYIYMQKSYNARLDSACARVVKSARFDSLVGSLAVECIKLFGHIDVVTNNIIECIASSTLEVSVG